ncbi:hypothetical protein [Streptomyces sp. GC420]|uniref:hypothetical protein n=1 Tax=Streptomyces sp. GC420 TaxID=2697568 RepID=UPI001414E5A3|nr:hypothetical protein [Streptomyces sp. GC420]NBM20246.1 hypothetical protein [Streptomyces sp. GC420]
MKTPVQQRTDAALDPVREALLRAARADAQAELDRADADAAATVAAAEVRARALLDEARRQGEAAGEAVGAADRVRARRAARARDLAARREIWDELCERVVGAVRELRHTADYPLVRQRLAERIRHTLGPGARIEEDPGGGLTGEGNGRRVDCTLDRLARVWLADRAGAEVETLWTRTP